MGRRGILIASSALAGCLLVVSGCGKDDVEVARAKQAQQPANPHPSGGATPPVLGSSASTETDGHSLPLKLTGVGSAAELLRELPKLKDPDAAAAFEQAFRLTFTSDAAKRDYATARAQIPALTRTHADFAPAYRVLAYAEFNLNPAAPEQSIATYEKALQLDPKYGEAHYAIAFLCAATGDRAKGVEHYKKAMELGVQDERDIGARFYADLLKPQ